MSSDTRDRPDWRKLTDGQLQDAFDLCCMLLEYRLLYIEDADKYKPLIAEAEADLSALLELVPGLPHRVNLHVLCNRVQLEQFHRRARDTDWELLFMEHEIDLDTSVPPPAQAGA